MAEIGSGQPRPARPAVRIDILRREPGIGMVSHGAVALNAALGVLRAHVYQTGDDGAAAKSFAPQSPAASRTGLPFGRLLGARDQYLGDQLYSFQASQPPGGQHHRSQRGSPFYSFDLALPRWGCSAKGTSRTRHGYGCKHRVPLYGSRASAGPSPSAKRPCGTGGADVSHASVSFLPESWRTRRRSGTAVRG